MYILIFQFFSLLVNLSLCIESFLIKEIKTKSLKASICFLTSNARSVRFNFFLNSLLDKLFGHSYMIFLSEANSNMFKNNESGEDKNIVTLLPMASSTMFVHEKTMCNKTKGWILLFVAARNYTIVFVLVPLEWIKKVIKDHLTLDLMWQEMVSLAPFPGTSITRDLKHYTIWVSRLFNSCYIKYQGRIYEIIETYISDQSRLDYFENYYTRNRKHLLYERLNEWIMKNILKSHYLKITTKYHEHRNSVNLIIRIVFNLIKKYCAKTSPLMANVNDAWVREFEEMVAEVTYKVLFMPRDSNEDADVEAAIKLVKQTIRLENIENTESGVKLVIAALKQILTFAFKTIFFTR